MTLIPFKRLAQSNLIIGHRGASGYAPENTLASFNEAVKRQADMIELDIQLTADHHWVVIHDLNLKRTCGVSKKVRITPLSLIKTLDAGSWFSAVFSGERVLTLEELLAWAKNKINLNIEIKGKLPKRIGSIPTLLAKISKNQMTKNVILSSFNWKVLREIRHFHRTIPIGILVNREPHFLYLREALDLKAFSIHLPKHRMKKGLSSKIHDHKLKIFLYTVNRADEIKAYSALGADGFFSDYPGLIRYERPI
ncbi:MAG: glycerophosphodiester phosphodiesterase [Nitrospirae bacterium]|nr:glycerophosphodiester phosphodiesterase [Nitrospirota bacterium]MBI3593896.1 glycerophosphodiester phosphodiesterase [Nitrospirota bacterium]